MVLDTEQQRTILLEMIKAASFPGEHLEAALALKQAVQRASLAGQSAPLAVPSTA